MPTSQNNYCESSHFLVFVTIIATNGDHNNLVEPEDLGSKVMKCKNTSVNNADALFLIIVIPFKDMEYIRCDTS
jgi:hypothetical protein